MRFTMDANGASRVSTLSRITVNEKPERIWPIRTMTANIVEYQCSSVDKIQSTYAKVAEKEKTTMPGPLKVRSFRVGAGSDVVSCSRDHMRRRRAIMFQIAK